MEQNKAGHDNGIKLGNSLAKYTRSANYKQDLVLCSSIYDLRTSRKLSVVMSVDSKIPNSSLPTTQRKFVDKFLMFVYFEVFVRPENSKRWRIFFATCFLSVHDQYPIYERTYLISKFTKHIFLV